VSVVAAGYKLTEVGVIPESWEVMRLGQLADFVTSGSRGWAQFYSEGGALFIRSQNVKAGRLDFSDRQHVVQPAGAEGNRTRVQQRDLLVTITGNSVGNVALVEHDLGEAYISQHVGLIRFQEPALASFVARYLAPGAPGNWQIAASQSGQSKPGLTLKDLHEFAVVLPEAAEQRAIAETLSDMDALLAGLDRLIAKKRDLKQAAMQQLLTGQTRLPGFQGEWESQPLTSVVADLEAGVSVNSVAGGGHHSLGEPGILKTSCVANGVFDPEEFKLIDQREVGRARLSLRQNTLIISRMNTPNLVGEVGFVEKNYPYLFLPDRLWMTRFRSDSGIWPKWLAYQMSSPITQVAIKDLASGTSGSMKNISKSKLLALTLDFPPSDEQEAIAAVLSDMDAELTALEARRNKTRALKQAMMQELLTGRTRLV
jgi:type I restriction enzyme S subunit